MKNYINYKRLLKKNNNIENDKLIRSLIFPREIFENIPKSETINVSTDYGKLPLPISIFDRILEDRVTYKVLEKNIKKTKCRYISIVSIDKDGNCEKKAEFSKKDIVQALIDVVLSKKDVVDSKKLDKCQKLAALISYERFLKARGKEQVIEVSIP